MMKSKIFILLLLLISICGATVAQDYYTDSQKKLLARRAAVVDAYRQLAESIKGVRISSNTTISDFVAISDEINAGMDRFVVRGAQVTATRYHADGTCEVDMEVNVDDLINFLELARGHYRRPEWEEVDFGDISHFHREQTVKATGTGAPPGGMSMRESQGLMVENQSLRQQIAGLKLTNEQLNAKLAKAQDFRESFYKLLHENNALKGDLEKKVAVEQQLAQVIRENQSLKKSIEQAEKRRLSLRAEIGKMADSLTKSSVYRQKYETVTEQASRTMESLKKLQKEKQDLKIAFVKQQEYRKKYERALRKIEKLQRKYEKENTQCRNLREIAAKLGKDVKTLQVQLKSAGEWEQKFEIERSNRQTIEREHLRVSEQQEKLQGEILQKKRKIAQLEIELANARNTGAWVAASPQQKLMARRAAILDGYRQLSEVLQGFKIDSKTTVRDFITTNDEIASSLQGYVRGAQVSATRYMPDGTCEVDMVVDGVDFMRFLKKNTTKNGERKWKKITKKLDKLRESKRHVMFRVTGSGTFKE